MRHIKICLALLGFMSVGVQCDNNIIKPDAGTSLVTDEGAAAVCLQGELVVFNTDTKVPFMHSDVTDFYHNCWWKGHDSMTASFEESPESYFFCEHNSFMIGTNSQFIPPARIWTAYVQCRG